MQLMPGYPWWDRDWWLALPHELWQAAVAFVDSRLREE